MNIFDAIRADVGRVFGAVYRDAVLMRSGQTTGSDDDPVPGVPMTFACKAMVDDYSDYLRTNSLVAEKDRKVLILAASIKCTDAGFEGQTTVPAMGDRVTVEGESFVLSEDIKSDPARAGWVCRGQQ